MLWIKVENISIFGKDLPAKKSHRDVNRLKANDPCCRKKYNRELKKKLVNEEAFEFMEKVKKEKEELLSNSNRISLEYKTKLKRKFKILHKRVREAQIETEETLRHIRAGKCA